MIQILKTRTTVGFVRGLGGKKQIPEVTVAIPRQEAKKREGVHGKGESEKQNYPTRAS